MDAYSVHGFPVNGAIAIRHGNFVPMVGFYRRFTTYSSSCENMTAGLFPDRAVPDGVRSRGSSLCTHTFVAARRLQCSPSIQNASWPWLDDSSSRNVTIGDTEVGRQRKEPFLPLGPPASLGRFRQFSRRAAALSGVVSLRRQANTTFAAADGGCFTGTTRTVLLRATRRGRGGTTTCSCCQECVATHGPSLRGIAWPRPRTTFVHAVV